MYIINQSKHIMFKYIENFLFLLVEKTPLNIALIVSRLMRKLLHREDIIEQKTFKNFQEYKKFIQIVTKNHSEDLETKKKKNNLTKVVLDNYSQEAKKKRIFFICCDENLYNNRKIPAIFLHSWKDTAVEAGHQVKVSIANKFMYKNRYMSTKEKKQYVRDVIIEIKDFEADLIFIDTNYYPNENLFNEKDIYNIKNKTNIPIYGFSGDFWNDDAIKSAQVWLPNIDLIFHSNIEMANINKNKIHYIPYTCSINRYYPEKEKDVSIFFSGVANISRFWYLLKTLKFCNLFFSNSFINFFKASKRGSIKQGKYDSLVRRSCCFLDLTHRSRFIKSTSGRMFQAMASETLLMAEECVALNKLLKPFVEYLPFRNGIELEYALTLLRDEPDLCKKIASEGFSKFKSNHSPNIVWNYILNFNKVNN